jgi:hypothetical protein
MAYFADSTVRFKATFKDIEGNVATVTSARITITDADGSTQVDEVSGTKEATGIYYYDYTFPNDGPAGNWIALWLGTVGSFKAKQETEFNVKI